MDLVFGSPQNHLVGGIFELLVVVGCSFWDSESSQPNGWIPVNPDKFLARPTATQSILSINVSDDKAFQGRYNGTIVSLMKTRSPISCQFLECLQPTKILNMWNRDFFGWPFSALHNLCCTKKTPPSATSSKFSNPGKPNQRPSLAIPKAPSSTARWLRASTSRRLPGTGGGRSRWALSTGHLGGGLSGESVGVGGLGEGRWERYVLSYWIVPYKP